MQKIKDLHAFIIGLNLFAAEQMDSFVDDLVITPAFRGTGVLNEVVAAEKDYTAMFFIERYPHKLVSPDQLLAQISAWLIENDPYRTDIVAFPMIVEVNDSETADLEFGISFNEWILAKEDPAGAIVFNNTRYALS